MKRCCRPLVSDPNRGIGNGLHFTESWKETLRKYLGDRDFDADLNEGVDNVARMFKSLRTRMKLDETSPDDE